MNFVALWTTMSAPSSSGRWSSGVTRVESTATSAPARCAPSHRASSSAIASIGFDGVSTHSRSAPAQAARTAAVSAMSTRTISALPAASRAPSSARVPV